MNDYSDFEDIPKNEPGIGMIPPHDMNAEAGCISPIIIEGSARLLDLAPSLAAEQFFSQAHRYIFEALLSLHSESRPTDIVSVATKLKDAGRIAQIGGMSYLTEILNAAPAATDRMFVGYAQTVQDKARLRELQLEARRILAESYQQQDDVVAFLHRAEDRIAAIGRVNVAVETKPIHGVTEEIAIELKDSRLVSAQSKMTNLDEFNRLFRRMLPGTLTIVGARPGVGKSAFALNNLAMPVALAGDDVVFFGLEMSNAETVKRAIASSASINASRLDDAATMTHHDWSGIISFASKAKGMRMHLCDRASLTVSDMRLVLRTMRTQLSREGKRIGLVVLDYLQLMSAPKAKGNASRQEVISDISRSLKILAKEFEVPVVALSQLNRAFENRSGNDSRPRLSDLRESGAIEQDADNVIFIHREIRTKEIEVDARDGVRRETDDEAAELIVAKARGGKRGAVKVRFVGAYTRFEEGAA